MATVREQSRTAAREHALDEIIAAAGDEGDCRSKSIEVTNALGNFPLTVNGRRTTVYGLVNLLRTRWVTREEVQACTDDPIVGEDLDGRDASRCAHCGEPMPLTPKGVIDCPACDRSAGGET